MHVCCVDVFKEIKDEYEYEYEWLDGEVAKLQSMIVRVEFRVELRAHLLLHLAAYALYPSIFAF